MEPGSAGGGRLFATVVSGGPSGIVAPPLSRHQLEQMRREEEARERSAPRGDWTGLRHQDWADPALVRARLEGGAPVDTEREGAEGSPLHLAAEHGAAEVVALLLERGARADARDREGHTPLWNAVRSLDEYAIHALIEAGADVWTPQSGPWSPGSLLLTTPLAPLVAELPGAVELSAGEVAAQEAADALIGAFGEQGLATEGLGVAFVRGVTEDEVIRRLGADPARCPRVDLEDEEDAPFDGTDLDAASRYVGVVAVAGDPVGCVVTQEGHMPSGEAVLRAISPGTEAYGVYFNPKGATFGSFARDGEVVAADEIGLSPHASDPTAYWTYRLWRDPWGTNRTFPHGADILAYACGAAGMVMGDGREAVYARGPRRWVALPEGGAS